MDSSFGQLTLVARYRESTQIQELRLTSRRVSRRRTASSDGASPWVSDGGGMLLKLNSIGAVVQNISVGNSPRLPVFDGSNIWVTNAGGPSVSVVRARDGIVLATLTGHGLSGPIQAAFDGQRILVTNTSGNSVSMWNAADLTPIGSSPAGASTHPAYACSDGINFWVSLQGADQLARF